ncbi:MAG: hypothetical protein JXA75_00010 [Candidatus Thermoplasmatota archaeon]|nr:hypothetical protein [Candidatus Thermoplasmatota archaeon]
MTKTSLGLEENVEAALCYLLIWISGLFFYFVEEKNKYIRFHAMQSILLFLPLMIFAWIFWFVFAILGWLIWGIVFVLWLVLMVKAYQMVKFKLPIIGDLAEKYS